ncbi:MAG: hypothetical protein ACLPV8_08390, partial [Steroidobacteraceae bacterium]
MKTRPSAPACSALALLCAAVAIAPGAGGAAAFAGAAASARVEARSADFLAVGVVHDDRMIIHLSRLSDNSPVRDAALTLVLRGAAHPTRAETDGSYTLQSRDLTLPGAAAVEFLVSQGEVRESLKGTLDFAAAAGQSDNRSNARQLWWWVLNFAVCIGFLWLFSRRRKAAKS